MFVNILKKLKKLTISLILVGHSLMTQSLTRLLCAQRTVTIMHRTLFHPAQQIIDPFLFFGIVKDAQLLTSASFLERSV